MMTQKYYYHSTFIHVSYFDQLNLQISGSGAELGPDIFKDGAMPVSQAKWIEHSSTKLNVFIKSILTP